MMRIKNSSTRGCTTNSSSWQNEQGENLVLILSLKLIMDDLAIPVLPRFCYFSFLEYFGGLLQFIFQLHAWLPLVNQNIQGNFN